MRVRLQVVQGRGAPHAIELDALSIAAAREQAGRQGYTVLSSNADDQDLLSLLTLSLLPGRSEKRLDVVVFVEQLHDLLTAGLSVIEALTTLQATRPAGAKRTLESLVTRLRSGEPLSAALAADAQFPELLVALVRAAELTSDLPRALTRFVEHEQRVRELRNKILSVAIYPSLLIGVGSAVLLFLLLHVMPRFARVFEGMSGALPWSAKAMIWWSQFLGGRGGWVLVAIGGVLLGIGVAAASPRGRVWLGQQIASFAPLRSRMRTYFLARWYRATGMLVEGGIPLPEALQLSNGLLPAHLRAGGAAVERALRDGHSPADAHVLAGMTTPVAEQLMRAGERTGDLGAVLTRIAQFHETEVARSLEQGMKALEPIVMVLIGIGVGTVVVLMYLPIFELASAIQ